MDPVPEIGRICREQELWLHVDAAMSGTAALCPEFRLLQDGIELADSYCFNPHKWMFTNFDCDCFYVADRAALIQTLSVLPEYLRNKATESGAVIDYRDWQIPLGRRFRALKLWFVIRHYGVEGLQYHIRQHVSLAQEFAEWVRADSRFELAAPAPLNLVCFRHKAGDEANQTLMDRLNRSGDLYLTHTKLDGKLTLRFCVGQTYTQARHVERAWKRIREEAGKDWEVVGLGQTACRALRARYFPGPVRKSPSRWATFSSSTRSSAPKALSRSLSASRTPSSRPARRMETRIFDRVSGRAICEGCG